MNNIVSLAYKGKQVRHMEIDGETWWVLVDVCKVLALSNSRIVASRLDKDEVSQTYVVDARGCKQRAYVVNESGLYSVLLRSDKPEAKPFKRWVTHEVLPSIRKTGKYAISQTEPQRKVETRRLDFECWPSLLEVDKAKQVFIDYMEKRIENTELPSGNVNYMSEEVLLSCALSEVWRQGKIWYKNHPEKTKKQTGQKSLSSYFQKGVRA